MGNSVIDMFMLGLRAFPTQDGERAEVRDIEYQPGGNGLNVAVGTALLGDVDVQLFTAIGLGNDSDLLRRACIGGSSGRPASEGGLPGSINLINANTSRDRHTDLSVIALANGNPRFLLYSGCSASITVEFLREHQAQIERSRVLHLCSIGGLPGMDLGKLADFLRDLRAAAPELKVMLDVILKEDNAAQLTRSREQVFALLHHADFFIPNELEAIQYSGVELPAEDEKSWTDALVRAAAIFNESVRVATIISRGPRGVELHERGKPCVCVPAIAVADDKIIDTVGAGDAWASGFLSAYLSDQSLITCCEIGNRIAAQSIQRHGGTEGIREKC